MKINKNENKFFPILKIQYTTVSKIDNIENNPDGTSTVNFNTGSDWEDFYSTQKNIKFSEPIKNVDEGVFYNQILELTNPGDELENNIVIHDLVNEDLIFKLDFIKGKSKILGTLDNPAKLISNFKYNDLKTIRSIKITRQSQFPIPYIS